MKRSTDSGKSASGTQPSGGSGHKQIKEAVKALRAEQKQKRDRITLFRAPVTTIRIFLIVLFQWVRNGVKLLQRNKAIVGAAVGILAIATALYFTPGSHQEQIRTVEKYATIALWWIFLGVLSSIGLGTGLHTFVLYLGPFIAKTTLVATECNTTDFSQYGDNSFVCPEHSAGGFDAATAAAAVSFWAILNKVQLEAFLWGAGTALGELPPYFVARAARLSGEKIKELQAAGDLWLKSSAGAAAAPQTTKTSDSPKPPKKGDEAGEEEEDKEEEEEDHWLIAKLKSFMFAALGKLGFFGILLFASIPNPLFDLAGITCGHFLVPFLTFFLATLIGKAIVKVHIQTLFVIVVFSKHRVDALINTIEAWVPPLQGTLHGFLEKEKAKLHQHGAAAAAAGAGKGVLGMVWDLVLITMVGYFVLSIVNAWVAEYLMAKDEEEVRKLRKKLEKKN